VITALRVSGTEITSNYPVWAAVTNNKGPFTCCLISIVDYINVIDMKNVVANLLHVLRNGTIALACYRMLCNGF